MTDGDAWLTKALDQVIAEIDNIATDPKRVNFLIAGGLAAGATWLMFYTDVPQQAVQAAGQAVAGVSGAAQDLAGSLGGLAGTAAVVA